MLAEQRGGVSMGREERVNGMEIVLGYPHPQRMDEGLLGLEAVGGSYHAPNIKHDFLSSP